MNINLEQIDELRKRAKVGYEAAKEALEKCNGDMVEALIYLEKQNKIPKDHCSEFHSKASGILKKGNSTNIVVSKEDKIVLSIPVTVAVIITVVAPYVSIPSLGVAIVTGHKIKFEGKDVECSKVNNALDKFSDVVDSTKKKFTEDTDNTSGIWKKITF